MLDAPRPGAISPQAVFDRCRDLSEEVLYAKTAALHWQGQAQRLAQQVRELQTTIAALTAKLNEQQIPTDQRVKELQEANAALASRVKELEDEEDNFSPAMQE